MQFKILFPVLDIIPISDGRWKFTLFILGIVFKGCLNGGPRQRAETDARYSQQLQTGTRPESVLQDGSPTLGLAPSEGK